MRNTLDRITVIVTLVVILIIGFIKLLINANKVYQKKGQLIEFRNEFIEFSNELVDKETFNNSLYNKLKLKSSKIQSIMGSYGIGNYKPAFANYFINDYQVILNSLSEIRTGYKTGGIFGSYDSDEIILVDDALLTCIGAYNDLYEEYKKECKNPLIWFKEGIKVIVNLPISIFYWGGLIKHTTYNKIISTFLFKIISFLVTLIGLISSIVTIIAGIEPLKQFISNIIKYIVN